MRYDFLRHRALSHRFVVALTILFVLVVTIGSGLRAAPSSGPKDTPFKLNFFIRPGNQADTLVFYGRVIEVSTDYLLAAPSVTFKRGSGASVRTVVDDREIHVDIRDTGSKVSAVLRVSQNGVPQQESTYWAVPQTDRRRDSRYTGEKISINLNDADIKDVLDKFSTITGADIQYPADLQGKVTINVEGIPWDEAFDMVLKQNKLTYQLKGGAIIVKQ